MVSSSKDGVKKRDRAEPISGKGFTRTDKEGLEGKPEPVQGEEEECVLWQERGPRSVTATPLDRDIMSSYSLKGHSWTMG